ncbi:MAG: ABC transporter permease [Clostridiales bacterium]|nr:ABC transporter permease [Clostridiales bacterium]
MLVFMRLYAFYLKRTVKDSFTIGYSVVFPIVMILLMGWLRKGSYGQELSSFSYYTIVLVPFCISFEVTTAAYLGQEEVRKHAAERFLTTPVSTRKLLLAKFFAGVSAMSICHGFVYLFASLVLRVSFHGHGMAMYLMSIAWTGVIYALGLWLGLGMKNFIVVKNLINLPIMLFAVLGGCFYPFGSTDPLIQKVIQASPLTWINRSQFLAMYDSKSQLLFMMTIIFVLLCIGIMTLAVIKFRKEAFCNGDMFSYEK